jgi:hypothetical protein
MPIQAIRDGGHPELESHPCANNAQALLSVEVVKPAS